MRQVSAFLPGTLDSSTNKADHHDITEILLKVGLNTITQTLLMLFFDVTNLERNIIEVID
jgi:predicted component of type VI protein secretion system